MANTGPTFAQIADAMAKIKAQEDATPPPSPAAKQAMEAAWEKLKDGLTDIALDDFGAAADAVGDAAKQLQGVIDSGTANADPIQQILGALGSPNKPPNGPVAPKAESSGQPPTSGSGTVGGSTAAPALSDRVPIPPRDQINAGLSACTENTMLKKFGKPGDLTTECSAATGQFLKRVRQRFDVGPFKITGLDYAVESLLQVFSDVRKDNQQLYNQVKNEGMLCVRARRHNPSHYSNHSWGTAIDIFFGSDVVPQGIRLAHRGNLLLAPYFNRHGWYWGAGFSGDSVDSMHFEVAEETIAKIPDEPLFDEHISPPLVAAAEGLAAPESFQTDPLSKRLLGDILAALTTAKPVKQSFNGVTYAAKLSKGELVFQSELQLDTDGWPDGKNQGDATWQPTTSLRYGDSGSINANAVPYFVLPQSWYSQFGIKVGDLGAVVYKEKLAFAVFADVGPKSKLGEGSLQLLRQLGEERLRPNGRVINAGMGGGVTTIVFPGSKLDGGYQDEKNLLSHIQTRGQILFLQLGGLLPSELADA